MNASAAEAPVLQVLSKGIADYFVPSVIGTTLRETLAFAHDPNRTATDLIGPLLEDSVLTSYLLRTDFLQPRFQDWMAETPDGKYRLHTILERTLLLLGRQASRNLIAGIEIHRITGTLPKKEKDRLNVQPAEQLRYALLAESYCETHDFAFADRAFIGGLHFDLLVAAFRRHRASRDALAAAPSVFADSIRAAKIAYALGRRAGAFEGSDWVFAAALASGIGTLLMLALFPKSLGSKSYAAFLQEADKRKAAKFLTLEFQELPRFGVRACELGALFVSWQRIMNAVEPAIRYAREPDSVQALDPPHSQLTQVLAIAHALAGSEKFNAAHARALKRLSLSETDALQLGKTVLNR